MRRLAIVIFLSAYSAFCMALFLEEGQTRFYWLGTISLILASMTKGTALVSGLCILMLVIFFPPIQSIGRRGNWRKNAFYGVALAISLALAVASAGYDFNNYRFYAHQGLGNKLHFFEPTFVGRPGVVSIFDSYFTFRFQNLMQFPYTGNSALIDPLHRTSVFTQLYGRLHFLHLDSWPPAWALTDTRFYNIGRYNFVLGLLPTSLFLFGFMAKFREHGSRIYHSGVRNWWRRATAVDLLPFMLTCGYLSFIVVFTHNYRDFAAMKPIYIFPGILGFTTVLASGYRIAIDRWSLGRTGEVALGSFTALLALGYCADVIILILKMIGLNGRSVAKAFGLF